MAGRRFLFLAVLLSSCSRAPSLEPQAAAPAAASLSPGTDSLRCADVDARLASVPLSKLPPARPLTRGTAGAGSPPPGATTMGQRLRATFVVLRTGEADMSTIRFEGGAPTSVQEEMRAQIAKQRFRPAMLEGCEVRGRGQMDVIQFTTIRRMGGG